MARSDGLSGQISSAKLILACIEKEAPRGKHGEFLRPYLEWVRLLRVSIQKGEAWSRNVPSDELTEAGK